MKNINKLILSIILFTSCINLQAMEIGMEEMDPMVNVAHQTLFTSDTLAILFGVHMLQVAIIKNLVNINHPMAQAFKNNLPIIPQNVANPIMSFAMRVVNCGKPLTQQQLIQIIQLQQTLQQNQTIMQTVQILNNAGSNENTQNAMGAFMDHLETVIDNLQTP